MEHGRIRNTLFRLLEIFLALCAITITLPIVVVAAIAVWLQDFRSPFYLPYRVGVSGNQFRLFKLRSMVVNADRSRVDTTIAGDPRVTKVGSLIRKFKLDELPQFWNVLIGDMALVGPRPNVSRETNLYTAEEIRMLSIRPGITDISSIVFSDLADILADVEDANIAYNQLIRPWKSRLALFYVDNKTLQMDLWILLLTAIAIYNRHMALAGVSQLLSKYNAPNELVEIAMRCHPLIPTAPPGASQIVTSRSDVTD